ncbi:Hypothetical protein GLP15_549 [Giardia lamblia P15]|uniref:Uncharacterized protein n=1 Tax=Giardia intestinalis (strain P15) TaxID=658858 RepID=E1F8K0_GIAIA|nr:Hypothetical protein GLP15_549 [Giardia lamblia P15]
MELQRLSLEAWIFQLEQEYNEDLTSIAQEYVKAKGTSGESSFLLASNMRAFRALQCLLTAPQATLSQEELETILCTVIFEVDNRFAFNCLRIVLEIITKQTEENGTTLHSHNSVLQALKIAEAHRNYRAMFYLASILDDTSTLFRYSCLFAEDSLSLPVLKNYDSKTQSIERGEEQSNDSKHLSNVLEELEHPRNASTAYQLFLINNVLSLLQSMIACQQPSTVFLRVEEVVQQLLQRNLPDTPGRTIFSIVLYCIQSLHKQDSVDTSQVAVISNIMDPYSSVDILFQSDSLKDQPFSCSESFINKKRDYKDILSYIKTLNTKIYAYEAEILQLQKQLETVRYRHREEAEINGKLNTALSEQLKEEIDRGMMLEKQSLEKDEVILSMRELLRALVRNLDTVQRNATIKASCELLQNGKDLLEYDDERMFGTDAGISSSLRESAVLAEKYIDSMTSNLADINDSLKKLNNEKQSLSMIQKHVLGLEYEQEQILNNRNDLDTELLEAELRHYRRLYFSLKAHYEAMVNLLPGDAAELANDILNNLVVESNERHLEHPKSSKDTSVEPSDELGASGQLFVDCNSAWNEQNSTWRRYMNDGEYQRYVERAVTPTGLSTIFRHQTAPGPDSKSVQIRPWSAVMRGENKEKNKSASKSFH